MNTKDKDSLLMCFKLLRNLELLSQQAHWNTKGDSFYQLHLMFERIYNLLHEFVDRNAENIRSLLVYVPNSPKFLADCKMEFPDSANQTPKKYLEFIHAGNRMLKECASDCMEMCEKAREYGVANMLQDLIEAAGAIYYLTESQLGMTEMPK